MAGTAFPSWWPTRRDLNAFDQWFEYRFHSMLIDLSAEAARETR